MFAFFESGVLIGFWQNEKTDLRFIQDTHSKFASDGRNCANITQYWYNGLDHIPTNPSFDGLMNLTDLDTNQTYTAEQIIHDFINEIPNNDH